MAERVSVHPADRFRTLYRKLLRTLRKRMREFRAWRAERARAASLRTMVSGAIAGPPGGNGKAGGKAGTLKQRFPDKMLLRIQGAPSRAKGKLLREFAAAGTLARLFDNRSPPDLKAVGRALTARPLRLVGLHFPRTLDPMFPAVPFSLEGVTQAGSKDVHFARAYPQHTTLEEMLARSPLREPTLEVFRGAAGLKTVVPPRDAPALVPVTPVFPRTEAVRLTDDTGTREVQVDPGRFTYLRVGRRTVLEVDSPVVFGDPLPLARRRRGMPRMVMSLFVDGLSADVFRTEAFERLMPNTHAFFRRGFVTLDARSASEWTLPSVASIVTGVRPAFHRVCHRKRFHSVSNPNAGHLYFPSVIQDMGFLTAQFCSNWRKSGGYGYLRGFDRTLTARGRYPAELVVADAIEHMAAFTRSNQYLWLTLFDLHHDHGAGAEFAVRARGETSPPVDEPQVKSVFKRRNDRRVEWYLAKIRRLDMMLGALYAHLERTYRDEDMVVGLFSDHGVSFLETEEDLRFRRLMDTRVRVPMMFRGRGAAAIPPASAAVNLDHFPTLLSCFAPLTAAQIDGRRLDGVDLARTTRTATISETVYPGQTYACRLETGGRAYQCVGGKVAPNGAVRLDQLEFFEQVGGAWQPRPEAAMPPALFDVVAEHGYRARDAAAA